VDTKYTEATVKKSVDGERDGSLGFLLSAYSAPLSAKRLSRANFISTNPPPPLLYTEWLNIWMSMVDPWTYFRNLSIVLVRTCVQRGVSRHYSANVL
jgi:hypothetical protein